MLLIGLKLLLQLHFAWAEGPCGETWNTAWSLNLRKNTVSKIGIIFSPDKYCEPDPPANANLKFEVLDVQRRVIFTKQVFVNIENDFDSVDSKTGKFSGGTRRAKKLTLLIKFPRTPATATGKMVRLSWKEDGQVIGTHEL